MGAASACYTRPYAHVLPQRGDQADCLTANLSRSLALLQSSERCCIRRLLFTHRPRYSRMSSTSSEETCKSPPNWAAWQGLTGSSQLGDAKTLQGVLITVVSSTVSSSFWQSTSSRPLRSSRVCCTLVKTVIERRIAFLRTRPLWYSATPWSSPGRLTSTCARGTRFLSPRASSPRASQRPALPSSGSSSRCRLVWLRRPRCFKRLHT